MYTIDKDVPPPADGANSTRGVQVYPFAEMQPGDSVFIEGGRSIGKEYSAARKLAHTRRKKGMECRFMARAENGGVRIWRVE